jgi:hypothetical protein
MKYITNNITYKKKYIYIYKYLLKNYTVHLNLYLDGCNSVLVFPLIYSYLIKKIH